MEIKGILFITGLLISSSISAQSLERSVVATSGNVVTNSTMTLEFTIGEAAVGSYTNSTAQLNTGFNQGYEEDNSSVAVVQEQLNITVFPNPAEVLLNVSAEVDGQIRVVSLLGVTVMSNQTIEANTTTQLDVANLSAGIYVVEVSDGKSVTRVKRVKN